MFVYFGRDDDEMDRLGTQGDLLQAHQVELIMNNVQTVRGSVSACVCLLVLTTCGCDGKSGSDSLASAPRPVAVITLEEMDPEVELRLTGSTEPWRDEHIGFEVPGRVKWVIEEGSEVQGRLHDSKGKQITKGDVLARLDDTRYQLAVRTAEASVAASEAKAAATKIELEEVLTEQLAAAEAELARAKRDYDRIKGLIKRDAASEVELYRDEAAFKVATANVNRIKASIGAKKAELKAIHSQTAQAKEAAESARKDLADCVLVAPFSGQVAKVHAIPGAIVQAGKPVVTLIMMDPISVEVRVSPDVERHLGERDAVDVFPPGSGVDRVRGVVWVKDTVADPSTRTFKVKLLVRNQRVPLNEPDDPSTKDLPRITNVWPIARERQNDPHSPVGVEVSTIYKDKSGQAYVWHVAGRSANQRHLAQDPVLTLKKVPVELGDRIVPLVGLYYFRVLKEAGGLAPERDLVASGVPAGFSDGGRALLIKDRWLLRPGDLVDVSLHPEGPGPGLYVPMSAVLPESEGTGAVFVVEDSRAVKVPVTVGEKVGELCRVTPSRPEDSARLREGAGLIRDGVHYLVPDEPVRVLSREPVKL